MVVDCAVTLDAYKAQHISIHAQALTILNIFLGKYAIMDHAGNNYTQWCTLFLIFLGKYAIMDHVLSYMVNTNRSAWVQKDLWHHHRGPSAMGDAPQPKSPCNLNIPRV